MPQGLVGENIMHKILWDYRIQNKCIDWMITLQSDETDQINYQLQGKCCD